MSADLSEALKDLEGKAPGRNGSGDTDPAPPAVKEKEPLPAKAARRPFFRSTLDRLFPTAQRIRFAKRTPEGGLAGVPRLFTPKELERCVDVHDFVARYLAPHYGDGEYQVSLIDGDGKESQTQDITVLPLAATAPPATTDTKVIDRLLDRVHALEADLKKEPAAPPPTITDRLAELRDLKKSLRELSGEDGSAAGGKGGDGSVSGMMLMMLLLNQRPSGSDDGRTRQELAELRTALREMREEMRNAQRPSAPRVDPFGPSPPPDEIERLERLSQLRDKIGPAADPAAGALADIRAELKALRDTTTKSELDGLKDEIADLRAQRESKGDEDDDPLDVAMRTVEKVHKAVEAFGGKTGGGGGSDTGDKILQGIELLTDPDRIRAIAEVVRDVKVGSPEPPRTRDKKLAFPAGFRKYTDAIEQATAPEDLVRTSMAAVEFLGRFTAWQGSVRAMAQACVANDKRKVLDYAKNFLEGLSGARRITPSASKRAIAAFRAHVDDVIKTVAAAVQTPADEEEAGEEPTT